MTRAINKAAVLAGQALRERETLAGAGREIMASFGLDEATARKLHALEVARRKREGLPL